MSLEQSDLRDRLPLFEEYKSALGDTSGRAYDHIDPAVISMMNNCVPVGLRPDNTLAIPKSYEPEDGPPVLMLRSGENVDVRWSDGMEKALQRVFRIADAVVPSGLNTEPAATSDGRAYLQSFSVPLSYPTHPENMLEPLSVPQYVGLRPQELPIDCSTMLLHECDHWDFFLNAAPRSSRPEAAALPMLGKSALAEKRAFATNYIKLANTGLTGYFMTAARLADYLIGHDPIDAAERALSMLRRYPPPQNQVSTVAVALSVRFAEPNIAIATHEVEAYRAAGIIQG